MPSLHADDGARGVADDGVGGDFQASQEADFGAAADNQQVGAELAGGLGYRLGRIALTQLEGGVGARTALQLFERGGRAPLVSPGRASRAAASVPPDIPWPD